MGDGDKVGILEINVSIMGRYEEVSFLLCLLSQYVQAF